MNTPSPAKMQIFRMKSAGNVGPMIDITCALSGITRNHEGEVQKVETFCEVHKSTGTPSHTYNLKGIVLYEDSGDEDVDALLFDGVSDESGIPIEFEHFPRGLDAGRRMLSGVGFLRSYNVTGDTPSPQQFTAVLEVTGTLERGVSAGS